MKRRSLIVFLLNLLFCVPLFAEVPLTTIILVRHAEKAPTTGDDPGLSAAGFQRAELLAKMFGASNLTAIYTSQYIRTKKTAEPLARKLGLQVQTVDASTSKKLAETILARHSGGTVLVVGHSNTLPEIIQAFGAGKITEIPDDDYDNLYFVTLSEKGKGKLVRLRFSPNP